MNAFRSFLPAVFLAVFCCLTAASINAQTAATGAILGVVTDPSGAAFAGANVELTSLLPGSKSTSRTGSAGIRVLCPLG